jgi:glycosyltransferase involved in cell wall biosynthesis
MNLSNVQNEIEISIVLGSYNRLPFLKSTIESVRNNKITVSYEIIVIDGGSNDGCMKWLAKQKDIITIVQHNHGKFRGQKIQRRSWGYFMNLGFKCGEISCDDF